MRRTLALVCVLMVAVAFMATAAGQAGGAAATPGEREVITYDTVMILWSDVIAEENSLYEQEILERFGIKFNVEYLSRAAYKEKMPIMLATGEGLEVVASGGPGINEIKQWAIDGYLVPMSDYLDQVPNYRKLFDQASWDISYAFASNADDKLYFLPAKRSTIEFPVNLVRAGTFKKVAGFVPNTTDKLYEAMVKVKAQDPDAVVDACWAATPWYNVHAFRTNTTWFVDPDSKKLEFGPATDKFRDALTFAAKMFGAGLTDQEWTPAGKQHWTELQTTGKTHFLHTYAYRTAWLNDLAKETDPEAGWIWTTDFLSAYPGKNGMTWTCMPIHYGGPFITTQCDKDKIPRFLEYLNWSATEEGQIFQTFGVEGETFEYQGGRAVLMDHIRTSSNPDGRELGTYGFGGWMMAESKDGLISRKGDDLDFQILPQMLKSMDKVHSLIAWEISKDQEKDLADLETVINDVWKEYLIKFITGLLDPASDTDWNKYQAELKKVGFDKVRAIRESAFAKSTVWP